MIFIALFQLVDSFNGPFVQDIASDAVVGVGGIGDQPAVFQYVRHPIDQSLLGIVWIDGEQHGGVQAPVGKKCEDNVHADGTGPMADFV